MISGGYLINTVSELSKADAEEDDEDEDDEF